MQNLKELSEAALAHLAFHQVLPCGVRINTLEFLIKFHSTLFLFQGMLASNVFHCITFQIFSCGEICTRNTNLEIPKRMQYCQEKIDHLVHFQVLDRGKYLPFQREKRKTLQEAITEYRVQWVVQRLALCHEKLSAHECGIIAFTKFF